MKRRTNSTNPVFREIRVLEEKALKEKKIKQSEIKTSDVMREEAWETYLNNRLEWLKELLSIE